MAFATNSAAFGIKSSAPANTSIFGGPKPAGSLFGTTQQTGSSFAPPAGQQPTQSSNLFGGGFGAQNQQNQQQQPQQPVSTGLFGQPAQQQQQPASTGLFGQPAQQQQQPASTGLFGQPAQQQQPASTGLFGQPAQQQQQPASTGLFGQPAQQQPASTSLFGQPAQQQQQPASTGLFGQPAQQQQQPASTGLFGQPAQQQPASTSLFGQPAQQQQQQPAASTNIFGQPAQQQQQSQQNPFGSSLFGNTTNNQSTNQPGQQQSNMFGNFGSTLGASQQQQPAWGSSNPLQAQPTLPTSGNFGLGGSTAGPSLFSNQQKQQPFNLSTQPTGPLQFTKSTKFNDLSDELKKVFGTIDSHIQGRVQISKELQQLKLGEQAIKGQESLRNARKELVDITSVIHSDVMFTRDLKAKTDQAVQDTITATGIVDGFRNPQQNAYLKNHAAFPLEYFTRITVQMRERLQWYKSTIEQIERKLSSTANQMQTTPQAISATLQAQHATFIALASKTATLDAELQKIKALYTQLWRQKTGSMRDPFHDLDRNGGDDFGLESLHVK